MRIRTIFGCLALACCVALWLGACGGGVELSQKEKETREATLAGDEALRVGLVNLRAIVEACRVPKGTYRACDTRSDLGRDALAGIPFGSGRGKVRVVSARRNAYGLEGTSPSGQRFTIVRDANGASLRECRPPGLGLCRADGRW